MNAPAATSSRTVDLDPAQKDFLRSFAEEAISKAATAPNNMSTLSLSLKEQAEICRLLGMHEAANRLDADGKKEKLFEKAGVVWRSPMRLSTVVYVVAGIALLGVIYEGIAYWADLPRLGLFGSKPGMPSTGM